MYSISDEHGNELQVGFDVEPSIFTATQNGWIYGLYVDHELCDSCFDEWEGLEMISLEQLQKFVQWMHQEFPCSYLTQNSSFLVCEGEDGEFAAALFIKRTRGWFESFHEIVGEFLNDVSYAA